MKNEATLHLDSMMASIERALGYLFERSRRHYLYLSHLSLESFWDDMVKNLTAYKHIRVAKEYEEPVIDICGLKFNQNVETRLVIGALIARYNKLCERSTQEKNKGAFFDE